ncbi:hypothetical protein AWB74_03229 [Caballeronia arvi]|uniref:Uncharacterized protein n=1 Tax=Caballeronia arvi TaxID=1777135 RepID=A0A158J1D6_9BURK|nr:hypothetical protein [Caballeronia arvi]SAL62555.1 hypothetical protein AWB74_03229 [Caballeronia arvi]
MDRNLPDKWQSVPLQSAVDEVPDYATLFDMTLVLTIAFSLFELAVELFRSERLNEVVALVAATPVPAILTLLRRGFSSAALCFDSTFSSMAQLRDGGFAGA